MIKDIGVQTFTVRKAQKKSIRGAYEPLIDLGIKNYEIARIDFDEKNANEIRALKEEYEIEVSAIQVKPKYVFGAVDKIARFCEITGCRNVVISMLPFECILGAENKFYSFISTLDEQYGVYEKLGLTLAYHHHNWEYVTLSGKKTRMDELISNTERIKFVHDTYWTAKSGIDPVRQITAFGDRLLGVHLRDLCVYKKGLDAPTRNCAIGEGGLDFARITSAAISAGCEYMVIEQKTSNPYEDIQKSYRNIHTSMEGII